MYPRNVNAVCSYVARLFASLQYTIFVFVGMQPQPDLFHSGSDSLDQTFCLALVHAMHHRIIGITLERNPRELPGHPRVERVVHEHQNAFRPP